MFASSAYCSPNFTCSRSASHVDEKAIAVAIVYSVPGHRFLDLDSAALV